MFEHIHPFRSPLFVVLLMILIAVSISAATNPKYCKAVDSESAVQATRPNYDNPQVLSAESGTRTDVDGHLLIYVVEPTGRWLDNGMSFPPAPPKPFGNAVIGYAFDQDVYLDESFDLTFDWDAAAAGFDDITEDNIKVVAAYFKTEAVATHFVVNGGSDLFFDAHHLVAAAAATPGIPGSNYKDGDYTHTVLIEEAAATW